MRPSIRRRTRLMRSTRSSVAGERSVELSGRLARGVPAQRQRVADAPAGSCGGCASSEAFHGLGRLRIGDLGGVEAGAQQELARDRE